jgi:hypothetical protein
VQKAVDSMTQKIVQLRKKDASKHPVTFYFDKSVTRNPLSIGHGVAEEIATLLLTALEDHAAGQNKSLDNIDLLLTSKAEPVQLISIFKPGTPLPDLCF